MSKKIPIYVDIADVLKDEIDQLAPNYLLPTEEQLSQRFEVSRVTVRAALELLENSGLISRLRGRGTIVSPRKVTRNFAPFSSFERDMRSQGIAFENTLLNYKSEVTPPESIRQSLTLTSDETVGYLSMTRSVEDRVICHDQRYYPPAIAKRIDPKRITSKDSLEALQDVLGAKIVSSNWESEIIHATGDVAEALGIASRGLVLTNHYIWFLDDGSAAESGFISYRIDRCKFRFAHTFAQRI